MPEMPTSAILRLLQTGTMEIEGLLPWSSNYSFLVRICNEQGAATPLEFEAVYKPQQGERPLWDFPQGTLCKREVAAFFLSNTLGWDIIPPTVLRNGTHGPGSVQLFIDHDPERHYFTFEGEPAYRSQLQKIVLFDILINNADRKSGHVLLQESTEPDKPDHLWGIDHGICFHSEYKLRTVIWEFVGQPIPAELMSDLIQLGTKLDQTRNSVPMSLAEFLNGAEIQALRRRLTQLIKTGIFPSPGPGRHYPWPPV